MLAVEEFLRLNRFLTHDCHMHMDVGLPFDRRRAAPEGRSHCISRERDSRIHPGGSCDLRHVPSRRHRHGNVAWFLLARRDHAFGCCARVRSEEAQAFARSLLSHSLNLTSAEATPPCFPKDGLRTFRTLAQLTTDQTAAYQPALVRREHCSADQPERTECEPKEKAEPPTSALRLCHERAENAARQRHHAVKYQRERRKAVHSAPFADSGSLLAHRRGESLLTLQGPHRNLGNFRCLSIPDRFVLGERARPEADRDDVGQLHQDQEHGVLQTDVIAEPADRQRHQCSA